MSTNYKYKKKIIKYTIRIKYNTFVTRKLYKFNLKKILMKYFHITYTFHSTCILRNHHLRHQFPPHKNSKLIKKKIIYIYITYIRLVTPLPPYHFTNHQPQQLS